MGQRERNCRSQSRRWVAQRWMAVGPSQPQTMPQMAMTTMSTKRCLRFRVCRGSERDWKYEPMDSTFTHWVRHATDTLVELVGLRHAIRDRVTVRNRHRTTSTTSRSIAQVHAVYPSMRADPAEASSHQRQHPGQDDPLYARHRIPHGSPYPSMSLIRAGPGVSTEQRGAESKRKVGMQGRQRPGSPESRQWRESIPSWPLPERQAGQTLPRTQASQARRINQAAFAPARCKPSVLPRESLLVDKWAGSPWELPPRAPTDPDVPN